MSSDGQMKVDGLGTEKCVWHVCWQSNETGWVCHWEVCLTCVLMVRWKWMRLSQRSVPDMYIGLQVKAEGRGTKKWCKRRCLEEQRFYEMTKLKRQFRDLLKVCFFFFLSFFLFFCFAHLVERWETFWIKFPTKSQTRTPQCIGKEMAMQGSDFNFMEQ